MPQDHDAEGGKLAAPRAKSAGEPGFCFKAAACLFGAALSAMLSALGPSFERLGVMIALAFWGFCAWKETLMQTPRSATISGENSPVLFLAVWTPLIRKRAGIEFTNDDQPGVRLRSAPRAVERGDWVAD